MVANTQAVRPGAKASEVGGAWPADRRAARSRSIEMAAILRELLPDPGFDVVAEYLQPLDVRVGDAHPGEVDIVELGAGQVDVGEAGAAQVDIVEPRSGKRHLAEL